jgi:hypothetical protein
MNGVLLAYFDAKLWLSDAVCAGLRPVSPVMFA